ncbi:hypothetical protein KIN20_010523 [Parelaphostrongylus tenuis]|uniref:Uncharacterized protein n=1 Tax=Parelaphostrongylus tenuis TaxID=148309 RepID=A0AAD5MBN6_PARTN|nr:hypothetical protein KIN20_010523 [Parelaphostrongylus tenuis]
MDGCSNDFSAGTFEFWKYESLQKKFATKPIFQCSLDKEGDLSATVPSQAEIEFSTHKYRTTLNITRNRIARRVMTNQERRRMLESGVKRGHLDTAVISLLSI